MKTKLKQFSDTLGWCIAIAIIITLHLGAWAVGKYIDAWFLSKFL